MSQFVRIQWQLLGSVLLLLAGYSESNLSFAAMQVPQGEQIVRASGVAGGTFDDVSYYKESFSVVRGFAPRPEDAVLAQLNVEWDPPELDELGNFLTLRGTLVTPSTDPQQTRPIDWFQGITFYLAKQPEKMLDWTKGIDQETAVFDNPYVGENGRVEIKLDLRETDYEQTQAQEFQIGIALARHITTGGEGQRVEWYSNTPVLPNTVQMLEIPAAAEIATELMLINRAAEWPFQDHDTKKLIRAVNALHALGKDRALDTLSEYDEASRRSGDYFAQHIVFWIVRVLFEPVAQDQRMPVPGLAVYLVDRESPEAANWPLAPMTLESDIPFMVGRQVNLGGLEEPASSYITWARKQGVLRSEPLAPSASPLVAAQQILNSTRFRQLDKYTRAYAAQHIRWQAIAMLEGTVPDLSEFSFSTEEAELLRYWNALLERTKNTEIVWEAETQRFIIK